MRLAGVDRVVKPVLVDPGAEAGWAELEGHRSSPCSHVAGPPPIRESENIAEAHQRIALQNLSLAIPHSRASSSESSFVTATVIVINSFGPAKLGAD